jgi:hypothetical protein
MNTRLTSALLLAAALGAPAFSPLSAAPPTAAASSYLASKITVYSWDAARATAQSQTVFVGSTRREVLSMLGQPRQELAPDVFLYDNCPSDQSFASDRSCNTLIVTFTRGRVANLNFVNDLGLEIVAANLRGEHTERHGSGSNPTVDVGFAIPRN